MERYREVGDRHLTQLELEKKRERDDLLTRLSFVLMELDQIEDELRERGELWSST